MQFGTNHLGHFAVTGLLLDRLLVVPDSTVVSVSSTVGAYAQSKHANLLFIDELQRRLTDTETRKAALGGIRGLTGVVYPTG